jgi:hypothetical protein
MFIFLDFLGLSFKFIKFLIVEEKSLVYGKNKRSGNRELK